MGETEAPTGSTAESETCKDPPTWWLEESPPALDQETRGGGFPGATQLSSRLWPSWMSAVEGWMEMAEEL